MAWYDGVYGDDPSTDNPFGREELALRQNPVLREFLRRGGALSDFARLNAERKSRDRGDEPRFVRRPA